MTGNYSQDFWQTKMGDEMIATVKAWNYYLSAENHRAAELMQARFEAFQISFSYIFGFSLNFFRSKSSFGILSENGDFLFCEDIQEDDQMFQELEKARQFSVDHGTVYAASNGSEIIWSDSRSQVNRDGFYICSIFQNGHMVDL